MDWVTSIHQAIQYIEEHLREELTIWEIAQQAALSPFYFQKGFAMLCGMTVGDYIRQRRLSAAGLEVLTTDRRIIDIALEFCYDSPDSFTKAFTRFHGLTPAALRKSGGAVRSFAPLRIKVTLEDGQNMDCKISIAPHGQQAIPMFQSQNLWYNSRTAAIILSFHAGLLTPCGATGTHGGIPFRRRRHGIIKNHKTLAL